METVTSKKMADTKRNSSEQVSINKELDTLFKINEVAKKLNSTLELSQIIRITIAEMPKMLNAAKCSIFLYDSETEELCLAAHNHFDLDNNTDVRIPISSNKLISRVVRSGKSALIRDIEKEYGVKNRSKYKSKSSMITLLKSGTHLIGTININDKNDSSEFDDWDFGIALNINEHLATAISNAQLFSQARRLSITDGLTGLFTHRYFQETMDREIQRAVRYKQFLSLMMMDIDFFKKVNDTYGHQAGDRVLKVLAKLLTIQCRRTDYACRYGGEEFTVILTDTAIENAIVTSERFRKKLEETTIEFGDFKIQATVSIGVSELKSGMKKQDMIEGADRALYRAKREGRNRVVGAE